MDIGDISGAYLSQLNSLSSNSQSDKLSDKLSALNAKGGEDDAALMDACKQFEAYFMEQMFKEMKKTVHKAQEPSGANSMLSDYYDEMFVQEVAKQSVENQSTGLAQMLYEQMKHSV